MNRLRGTAGFTLIELVMVLAVIGVVSAFAIPSLTRYRVQEEAKEGAQRIAGALRDVRTQSMKQGIPHFALFWPNPQFPVITTPTTLIMIVRDTNGNFQFDAGETVRNVDLNDFRFVTDSVTGYNAPNTTPPHPTGARFQDDPTQGALSTVPVNGTAFQEDRDQNPTTHPDPTGLFGIGFTTRGIPVDLDRGTVLGSGAGVFYLTDNVFNVYAVTVGGLGEIRVRSYMPHTNTWR